MMVIANAVSITFNQNGNELRVCKIKDVINPNDFRYLGTAPNNKQFVFWRYD